MDCVACGNQAQQLHHIVYQQHLRNEAGDLTPRGPKHKQGRKALAKQLAGDRRNLVPVCEPCHAAHHNGQHRLNLALLPDDAFTFATELLGEDRALEYLTRRYKREVKSV